MKRNAYVRSGVLVLSSAALLAVAGLAIAAPDATLPPGFVLPHGQHDVRMATAGTYAMDVAHTAVITRVSHLGFSMSTFRFGKSSATLLWDPAHIEKSSLKATVDPASIDTPVPGFAKQLLGVEYLNTAKYPTATFVSTAFHAKDFQHGTVDGKLTIMGKTMNATFDVTLTGAGPGFAASPTMGHVIGIHAVTHVDPHVLELPAPLSDPIEITIDTEFTKKG